MSYSTLAPQEKVAKVIEALVKNNISAEFVQTKEEAKTIVIDKIPKGSDVMTMTSITLEQSGIDKEINESGKFISIRNKLSAMNRETQSQEMQQLGAAPEWVLGSVHAITEDGVVIVVSNTGSQLPAYSYGSAHVIWVVSTKKIVKDIDDGMNRIHTHIIPKESVRARAAYGLPDSWDTFASKILIFHREPTPDRIHIVFVNEDLGF